MSQRARTGIFIALAGIALVAIGFYAISFVVQRSLAPLPQPTQPPPLTEKVVITAHDIALGAVLKAGDLAQVEVPVEMVPSTAIRDMEQVVGRITKIPLVAGEMVMPHHLADPTNKNHDLAFVLGDDQVLMAFPIDDLMTQLNILQRGDVVDILASLDQPVPSDQTGLAVTSGENQQNETRLFTFNALQRTEITAIVVEIVSSGRSNSGVSTSGAVSAVTGAQPTPQPTPIPAPSQTRPQALLLALNPQDALVLKNLKDAGATFDFVLRSPTSTVLFDAQPVMSEYLTDRYQLIIRR